MTQTSESGSTDNEVKVSRHVLASNRNALDRPRPSDSSSTSSTRLFMRRRQEVCVLGATGSVGVSTLDVIARNSDRYRAFALSGYSNLRRLEKQCLLHQPTYAVVPDAEARETLQKRLIAAGSETQVLDGQGGLHFIASHREVDCVVAAIVGAAGLRATLTAVNAGKKILLANKEALVMSGGLFMQAVRDNGAILLPIDSEHNAISQCLPARIPGNLTDAGVRRILLTASGGPFREMTLAELHSVTPEQACAHPTWSMGRKISVDSASLMNKGLELIEACWLFNAPPQKVEVVIHPQSIVHSLVDYVDGSMLAHLSNPDMRIPISHALAWPRRIDSGVDALDLFKVGRLDFQAPDETRFPCLALARQAAREGGTAPALLNAVNEVAVQAFLARRIGFTQIAQMIDTVLNQEPAVTATNLESILDADTTARRRADEWLAQHGR